MKTLKDIVTEHLRSFAALIRNPEALVAKTHEYEGRIEQRLKNDPSLAALIDGYSKSLAPVLRGMPREAHEDLLQKVLVELVMVWEDCNIEYEKQLKANEASANP